MGTNCYLFEEDITILKEFLLARKLLFLIIIRFYSGSPNTVKTLIKIIDQYLKPEYSDQNIDYYYDSDRDYGIHIGKSGAFDPQLIEVIRHYFQDSPKLNIPIPVHVPMVKYEYISYDQMRNGFFNKENKFRITFSDPSLFDDIWFVINNVPIYTDSGWGGGACWVNWFMDEDDTTLAHHRRYPDQKITSGNIILSGQDPQKRLLFLSFTNFFYNLKTPQNRNIIVNNLWIN